MSLPAVRRARAELEREYERRRAVLDALDLAVELLPRRFTRAQLRRTVEEATQRRIDRRNFETMLWKLDVIRPCAVHERDVGHRPAQLYAWKRR